MTAQKQDLEIRYVTEDVCERLHEQFQRDCDSKVDAIQREIDMKYDESLRDRVEIKKKIDDTRGEFSKKVDNLASELSNTRLWAIRTFLAVILGLGGILVYIIASGGFATNKEMAEVKGEIKVLCSQQAVIQKTLEDFRHYQMKLKNNEVKK